VALLLQNRLVGYSKRYSPLGGTWVVLLTIDGC
jgi:hypothetical protein